MLSDKEEELFKQFVKEIQQIDYAIMEALISTEEGLRRLLVLASKMENIGGIFKETIDELKPAIDEAIKARDEIKNND